MKLRNNREYFRDIIWFMVVFPLVSIAAVVLNELSVNKTDDVMFYVNVVLLTLIGTVLPLVEYKCSEREFCLEDDGFAVYKKNKRTKFFPYEKVTAIYVRKTRVVVYSIMNPDYPYAYIRSVTYAIFKYLTSSYFRKRWLEYVVEIRNRKKDYDSYLKPFLEELLRRTTDCEVFTDDDCKKWAKLENPNKRPPQTDL